MHFREAIERIEQTIQEVCKDLPRDDYETVLEDISSYIDGALESLDVERDENSD